MKWNETILDHCQNLHANNSVYDHFAKLLLMRKRVLHSNDNLL